MVKSIVGILLLPLGLLFYEKANAHGYHQDTVTETEYNYLHPSLFEGRIVAGTNFCQIYGDPYGGYHKVGLNAGGMVYVHF